MAFTQSSTTDLSLEEYIRRFDEAYELRMPPYDFRVWDRYLFSRCSEKVPVLGLFQLFEWPMTYLPGTSKQCYETVGQWCIQGTFIDAVKNIIESLRDRHFDRERPDLDLAFIEKHQAIFDHGPMQLSAVGKEEQDAWCDEAKACILSKSPHDATLRVIYPLEWFARQEAYFAFGVLAWNIRQDPGWVTEDIRLDVWHKLGFSVATQQKLADELLAQYEQHFPLTFDFFLYSWAFGILAEKLQIGLKSKNSTFWKHLTTFFKKKTTKDESAVFRLYQAVSLNNDAYLNLTKTRDWGVFENARKNYKLDGFSYREDKDGEERNAITRKDVFFQVLRNIEDPMAIDAHRKCGDLREFISQTYKDHNMQLSEETLNIACCDY